MGSGNGPVVRDNVERLTNLLDAIDRVEGFRRRGPRALEDEVSAASLAYVLVTIGEQVRRLPKQLRSPVRRILAVAESWPAQFLSVELDTERLLAALSAIPELREAVRKLRADVLAGRLPATSVPAATVETGHRTLSLEEVRAHSEEIRQLARRRRLRNIRVFGSVARGEADEFSDLDLLVDADEDASLFDIVGFERDVSDLLGVTTQVTTPREIKPRIRARVIAEAATL